MLGIVPQTRLAGYLTPSPTHKAAGVQCAPLRIKWRTVKHLPFSPGGMMAPPTTHFLSNFAFFSPYRPKIQYQALQSLKNHSKIERYIL